MDVNYTNQNTLSEVITWLRFPLIFLIILLHSYSCVRLDGNHELYFKLIYPLGLWIGETGVPGFFFISGFLFFLSKKNYIHKQSSRVRTLLIPYLLWNSILILLYLAAFVIGYPQDINGKNISDYGVIDYLRLFWDRGSYDNGNFVPILCPFWYIRNLFIMCLLSPLFYYLIRYGRELFLLIVAGWWLATYHNAFIPQTVLFFSLGAYFSILKINPLQAVLNYRVLFLILFVLFAVADIGMHTIKGTTFNLQVHRLALIFNIPALLLLGNTCVVKGYVNDWLSRSAFIVFAVHYPIVIVLRKMCVAKFTFANDVINFLLYMLCVGIVTAVCLLIYIFLDCYFPKTKKILSGNR